MKSRPARAAATLGFLGLVGCSNGSAPSFIVFGAYVPGWMMCGAAGLVAVIATRAALILTGLSESAPFQLGVCVSAGIITASLVWFIWFGR
jgi:YtcA family